MFFPEDEEEDIYNDPIQPVEDDEEDEDIGDDTTSILTNIAMGQQQPVSTPAVVQQQPVAPTVQVPQTTTPSVTPQNARPAQQDDPFTLFNRPSLASPSTQTGRYASHFQNLEQQGLWGEKYGKPVGQGNVQIGGGITAPEPSYITGVRTTGSPASSSAPRTAPSAINRTAVSLPDRMDTTSRQANLRQWAPVLAAVEKETGLSARAVAAIIIAENGGGDSEMAQKQNNYFSIHAWDSPRQIAHVPGDNAMVGTYKNPKDSLEDFIDLISNAPRYAKAWAARNDPKKFFEELIDAGYIEPGEAGRANWRKNLHSGLDQYDQIIAGSPDLTTPTFVEGDPGDLGQAAKAATSTTHRVISSTLRGITPSQADYATNVDTTDGWSLCSPVAAVGQLAALGITVSIGDMKQQATKVGWTSELGQAGPTAHAQMINNVLKANGVTDAKAVYEEGLNWDKIAQLVQSGKPVVLNAMNANGKFGHYFVAEDYDPSTGKFYLGNSLLSLRKEIHGGNAWVTPEELFAMQSRSRINMHPSGIVYIEGGATVTRTGSEAAPVAPSTPTTRPSTTSTEVTRTPGRAGTVPDQVIRADVGNRPVTLWDIAMGQWAPPSKPAAPPPALSQITTTQAAPTTQAIPDWRQRNIQAANQPTPVQTIPDVDLDAVKKEQEQANAYQKELDAYLEQVKETSRKNIEIERTYQEGNTERLIRGESQQGVSYGEAGDVGLVVGLGTQAGEDRPAYHAYPPMPKPPATPNLDKVTEAVNKKNRDAWIAGGQDASTEPKMFDTPSVVAQRVQGYVTGAQNNEQRVATEYGQMVGEARTKFLEDLQKEQERRMGQARAASYVPPNEYTRFLEENSALQNSDSSGASPSVSITRETPAGTRVISTEKDIDELPTYSRLASDEELTAAGIPLYAQDRIEEYERNKAAEYEAQGYISVADKERLRAELAQRKAVQTSELNKRDRLLRLEIPMSEELITQLQAAQPEKTRKQIVDEYQATHTSGTFTQGPSLMVDLGQGFRDVQAMTGAGLMGLGRVLDIPSLQRAGANVFTNAENENITVGGATWQSNRYDQYDPRQAGLLNHTARAAPSVIASFVPATIIGAGLMAVGAEVGVVTAAGIAVGAATSFLQEGGDAYTDALKSGASQEQASAALVIKGSVNAGIEVLPIGKVLSRIPGGKAIAEALGSKITDAAAPILASRMAGSAAGRAIIAAGTQVTAPMIKNFLAEGGQEWMQEAVGIAVENLYKDSSFNQLFQERGLQSFLVGGILGAGTEAIGIAGERIPAIRAGLFTERSGTEPENRTQDWFENPYDRNNPAYPAEELDTLPSGNTTLPTNTTDPETSATAASQPTAPTLLGVQEPLLQNRYDNDQNLVYDESRVSPEFRQKVEAVTGAYADPTLTPAERVGRAAMLLSSMETQEDGLNPDQRAFVLERFGISNPNERHIAAISGYHMANSKKADQAIILGAIRSAYGRENSNPSIRTFQNRVNTALQHQVNPVQGPSVPAPETAPAAATSSPETTAPTTPIAPETTPGAQPAPIAAAATPSTTTPVTAPESTPGSDSFDILPPANGVKTVKDSATGTVYSGVPSGKRILNGASLAVSPPNSGRPSLRKKVLNAVRTHAPSVRPQIQQIFYDITQRNGRLTVADVLDTVHSYLQNEDAVNNTNVTEAVFNEIGIDGIQNEDGSVLVYATNNKTVAGESKAPSGQKTRGYVAVARENANKASVAGSDVAFGQKRVYFSEKPDFTKMGAMDEQYRMVPVEVNSGDLQTDENGDLYIDTEGKTYVPLRQGLLSMSAEQLDNRAKAEERLGEYPVIPAKPTTDSLDMMSPSNIIMTGAAGRRMYFEKDALTPEERTQLVESPAIQRVTRALVDAFARVEAAAREVIPNAPEVTFEGLMVAPGVLGLTKARGRTPTSVASARIFINVHAHMEAMLVWATRMGVDPESREAQEFLTGLFIGTLVHEYAHVGPTENTNESGHGGAHTDTINNILDRLQVEDFVDLFQALDADTINMLDEQAVGIAKNELSAPAPAETEVESEVSEAEIETETPPVEAEPSLPQRTVRPPDRKKRLTQLAEERPYQMGDRVTVRGPLYARDSSGNNAETLTVTGKTRKGQIRLSNGEYYDPQELTLVEPSSSPDAVDTSGMNIVDGDQRAGVRQGSNSGRIKQRLAKAIIDHFPGGTQTLTNQGVASGKNPRNIDENVARWNDAVRQRARRKDETNKKGEPVPSVQTYFEALHDIFFDADEIVERSGIDGYTYTENGVQRQFIYPHAQGVQQNANNGETGRARLSDGALDRSDETGGRTGSSGNSLSSSGEEYTESRDSLRVVERELPEDANVRSGNRNNQRRGYVPGTDVRRDRRTGNVARYTRPPRKLAANEFWSSSQGRILTFASKAEHQMMKILESLMHNTNDRRGRVVEWRTSLPGEATATYWDGSPLSINYARQGNVGQFNPDFLVRYEDGSQEIIEIKRQDAALEEDPFFRSARAQKEGRKPRAGWFVKGKAISMITGSSFLDPDVKTTFRIIGSDDPMLTGRSLPPSRQKFADFYKKVNQIAQMPYEERFESIEDPQERYKAIHRAVREAILQADQDTFQSGEGTNRAAPVMSFVADPDQTSPHRTLNQMIPNANKIMDENTKFGLAVSRLGMAENPINGERVAYIETRGDIAAAEKQAAELAQAAGTADSPHTYIFITDSRGTDIVHSLDIPLADEIITTAIANYNNPSGPTLTAFYGPDGMVERVILSSRTPDGRNIPESDFTEIRDNFTDMLYQIGMDPQNIQTQRGFIRHFNDREQGGVENVITRSRETLGEAPLGGSENITPTQRYIPVGNPRGRQIAQYNPDERADIRSNTGTAEIPDFGGVVQEEISNTERALEAIRENPDVTRDELRQQGIKVSDKTLQRFKNQVAREDEQIGDEVERDLMRASDPFDRSMIPTDEEQVATDLATRDFFRARAPRATAIPHFDPKKFSNAARPAIIAAAQAIHASGAIPATTRDQAAIELGVSRAEYNTMPAANLTDIETAAVIRALRDAKHDIDATAKNLLSARTITNDDLADFISKGIKFEALAAQLSGNPSTVRRGSRDYTRSVQNVKGGESHGEYVSRLLNYAKTQDKKGRRWTREFVQSVNNANILGAQTWQLAQAWHNILNPKTEIGDWIIGSMYSALLGIRTFSNALIGNSVRVLWRFASDIVSTVPDEIIQGYMKNGIAGVVNAPANIGKVWAMEFKGLFMGFFNGIKAFLQTVVFGATRMNIAMEDYPTDRLQNNRLGNPILNKAANAVGWTMETFFGRLFTGADAFAKAWSISMHLGRTAAIHAREVSPDGKFTFAQANYWYNNPTEEMLSDATRVGLHSAFRGKTGFVGNVLTQVQSIPIIGRILFPFLKTLYHSAIGSVNATPIGMMWAITDVMRDADGRNPLEKIRNFTKSDYYNNRKSDTVQNTDRFWERIRDSVFGTAIASALYYQIMNGLVELTGAPPDDQRDRDEWEQNGKIPYGIRIKGITGDKMVSYANWGPPAPVMATMGNYIEYKNKKRKGDPDEEAGMIAALVQDTASSWVDLTFFSSLAQTLGNVTDASRGDKFSSMGVSRFATDFVSSRIPFGANLTSIANTQDPYVRSPKSNNPQELLQQILQSKMFKYVPFTKIKVADYLGESFDREQVKPRIDVWGQPQENPYYGSTYLEATINGMNPFRVIKDKQDPVNLEIQRLKELDVDKRPTRAPAEYEGYKFKEDELYEWQRRVGQSSYLRLQHLFQQDIYKNAPLQGPGSKANMIDSAYNEAKKYAWETMGLTPTAQNPNREPKYRGLEAEAQRLGISWWDYEKTVDDAISKYNEYRDALRYKRRPPAITPDEIRLANRFEHARSRTYTLEQQRGSRAVKSSDDTYTDIPFQAVPNIP